MEMIQDIQPHHLFNQYRPVPPDGESFALYYEEHAVLVKRTENGIEFPGSGNWNGSMRICTKITYICFP